MEQKSKYVAPSTRRVTVELEQGFMSGGSVYPDENGEEKAVHATEQDAGIGYDFSDNTFNENLGN